MPTPGTPLAPGLQKINIEKTSISSLNAMKKAQQDMLKKQQQAFGEKNQQDMLRKSMDSNNAGTGNHTGIQLPWEGMAQGLAGASNIASNYLYKNDKIEDPDLYGAEQGAGDVLMGMGNVYTTGIGAAIKAGTAGEEALGIHTSGISRNDAGYLDGISEKDATLSKVGAFAANVLGPGFGAFVSKTRDGRMAANLEQGRNSYQAALGKINASNNAAGKKILMGRKKRAILNDNISQANVMNDALSESINYNTIRQNSDYASDLQQQWMRRMSGINDEVALSKQGSKLIDIDKVRELLASRSGQAVSFMQNGGSIMNPAGALHATLNHIESQNEEIGSQVTQKGIPIISASEGGELTQVAEIERDEFIVEKSLTEKLESLWKDGTDEAAIEAGRLIANAIMEDAADNTGLIEEVE